MQQWENKGVEIHNNLQSYREFLENNVRMVFITGKIVKCIKGLQTYVGDVNTKKGLFIFFGGFVKKLKLLDMH